MKTQAQQQEPPPAEEGGTSPVSIRLESALGWTKIAADNLSGGQEKVRQDVEAALAWLETAANWHARATGGEPDYGPKRRNSYTPEGTAHSSPGYALAAARSLAANAAIRADVPDIQPCRPGRSHCWTYLRHALDNAGQLLAKAGEGMAVPHRSTRGGAGYEPTGLRSEAADHSPENPDRNGDDQHGAGSPVPRHDQEPHGLPSRHGGTPNNSRHK